MKRIAMLLVIMLLAIASVFSAALPANQNTAKTEVVLNLTAEDVTDYRIGFAKRTDIADNQTWQSADKINDMTDIPTKADAMNINYEKGTGYASSAQYSIFYKIRGAKNITLTLKADKALHCDGKADINYTVTPATGTGSANSETGDKWTSALIELDASTGTANGVIPVEIKTNTTVNASAVGNYSSTVTMTVKAEA